MGHYGLLAVKGIIAKSVANLPGELRARVRAAGPPGLSPAAPLAIDARNSGLVVAALLLLLLLLELCRGATGLAGYAAS